MTVQLNTEAAPDSMQDLPVTINRSKLYPPPIAPDAVQRQRLLSLARSAAQYPITLVSAPAGYGKSTLVSQWTELFDCESTWLSLDPADSDLTQFLSYFVAALRNCHSRSCPATAELLQSVTLPDVDVLGAVLCNEIEALVDPIVVVLDDYHRAASTQIDEFLDTLLNHPPPNLHLAIITRRDPGLSIPALRARGALCDVRMQQLRFREDETSTFVRAHLGDAIKDEEIRILHERTEGWPAALRLARLASTEPGSAASFVDQLPDDSHAVRTYLMQEVLANQPPEIREYLIRTAFLDRFCPELCEAITPDDTVGMSGRDFVDNIREANLFTIALDASEDWFRFHHLFQSMLEDQALTDLDSDVIRDIHMRASRWYEEHGFLSEAIQHALSADKPDEAAEVIVRNRHDIMNHERWHQLGIWFRLLPAQVIQSRPALLLMKARIFRTTGQDSEMVQALDDAESLLNTADIEDDLKEELFGSVASMRCFQIYMQSDGKGAARMARRALELLSPGDLAERGFAMILLGAALQMTGDTKGAISAIYSEMADELAHGGAADTYKSRLLDALIFVHWMEADLRALAPIARDAEELCRRAGLWEVLTGALQFKAAVHYQLNELSAIESDLEDLLGRKAIANLEFHARGLIIMAVAQQALGNSDNALKNSKSLRDLAFKSSNPYLIGLSEALSAELAMRQGHMAEALKWANNYDPDPLIPMYAFFSPQLCLARILVRDDSADSRKQSVTLLPKLEEYLRGIHNKTYLIETLALRALLSERTGESVLATEQLSEAVSLARPGGFIRVFVDIGPELLSVLNRLELKTEELEYVGRIVAAFQSEGTQADGARANAEDGTTVRDISGLSEPLSRREMEVLTLLVRRLSNREIAERLFISTATVKRHAHNIYEKLNVKGRREAAAKAVGLGLTGN